MKNFLLILLFPCLLLAQVLPAESTVETAVDSVAEVQNVQVADSAVWIPPHKIDYFAENLLVLLGFGWRYTLDGDTLLNAKKS